MKPTRARLDVERTPADHFGLVATAAVLRLVLRMPFSEERPDRAGRAGRYDVLEEYLAPLAAASERVEGEALVGWWEDGVRAWEEKKGRHLPLQELARATKTGFEGEVAAVLAAFAEGDARVGAVLAEVQGTPGSRRPTVGLLEALVEPPGRGRETIPRRLLRLGWLRTDDDRAPWAERHVRLPVGVWDVLCGRRREIDGWRVTPVSSLPQSEDLVLPEAVSERVHRLPELVRGDRPSAVVIRGPEGSGRRTVAGFLARQLGRRLVRVPWSRPAPDRDPAPPEIWDELGPVLRLGRTLPLVALEGGAGQAVEIPAIPGWSGPLLVTLGRHGGVVGPAVARSVHVELPTPGAAQRVELWRRALGGQDDARAEELASLYHFTGGTIERVAHLAGSVASLDDRENAVTARDVREASGLLSRHRLEPLAQRLEVRGSWTDLLVKDTTADDLEDLELRCRHREALPRVAGPALEGTLGRGVRALFNGPTGTGKTLAARILASELEKDLYRIDLSAVVDKYVGETEKRLDEVLSRAEDLDVVLLLDEGDALLTGRTDVRSSNDRYANLETNFLLQRLESYQGILVVTTNAGNRIDVAFQRRFDQVVDFPPPGPRERIGIWLIHLPPVPSEEEADSDAPLTRDELSEVAARTVLTGGQIRNAALHASLLALRDGREDRVSLEDVERAVRREYRKAGAAYPDAEAPTAAPVGHRPRLLAGPS